MKKMSIGTFLEKLKNDRVFLHNLIKKALTVLGVLILVLALAVILIDDNKPITPQNPNNPPIGGGSSPEQPGEDENEPTDDPVDEDPEPELGEALVYSLSSDGSYYSVVGIGDERHTEIVIPDTYSGLPVKRIEQRALFAHPAMTTLLIGNNVEYIGAYAVSDSHNLRELTIGDGVKTIADEAFSYCDSLIEVRIPDKTERIGSFAFYCCPKLISVTLGRGLKSVGAEAFIRCTKLIEVVNLSTLSVKVGDDTHGAVAKYASYVSRTSSMLDVIDGFYFAKIGGENCLIGYDEKASSIILPESYKGKDYVMHDYAFYGCQNLHSVTVPETVGQIGEYSFVNCYRLAEVINRSELELTRSSSDNGSIARYALAVHDGDSRLSALGDYVFYEYETTKYLIRYTGSRRTLSLPDRLEASNYAINQYTFYDNRVLESIYLPDNVSSMGSYAFSNCTSLYHVRLSENFSSINSYVFRGCVSLTSITIPQRVAVIGLHAFDSCYKLTEVINHSSLPISLDATENFGNIAMYAKEIHVGNESKLVRVGDFVFYSSDDTNYLISYVGNDKNIVLPKDLNGESYKINRFAFYAHHDLKSVTVSDGVTEIGKGAFTYCYGLESIVLGTGLRVIDVSAFSGCSSLKNTYFCGGEFEWLGITVYNDNSNVLDTVRYYASTSPIFPDGYWHYDTDGNPVLWK